MMTVSRSFRQPSRSRASCGRQQACDRASASAYVTFHRHSGLTPNALADPLHLQDVGFGSGESVRLLASEFAPAKLIGVTSLESQHARAGA